MQRNLILPNYGSKFWWEEYSLFWICEFFQWRQLTGTFWMVVEFSVWNIVFIVDFYNRKQFYRQDTRCKWYMIWREEGGSDSFIVHLRKIRAFLLKHFKWHLNNCWYSNSSDQNKNSHLQRNQLYIHITKRARMCVCETARGCDCCEKRTCLLCSAPLVVRTPTELTAANPLLPNIQHMRAIQRERESSESVNVYELIYCERAARSWIEQHLMGKLTRLERI